MKHSKRFIYLVIISILTIVITYYYYYYFNTIEEINNINKVNIGNFLSEYICNIINAIIKEEDFEVSKNENIKNMFLNNLSKRISYESRLKQFRNSLMETGTQVYEPCRARWYSLKDDVIPSAEPKLASFFVIKPMIHKIMKEALENTDIGKEMVHYDHPVIHFRCSDTPFVRNEDYKIQRYAYFKEALKYITNKTGKKYKNLTIISSVEHKSQPNDKEACRFYATELKKYLDTELGYEVDITSHTDTEDFAILFYAPAVISTGGSYSFLSGFFGNGVFVMPQYFPFDNKEPWILPGFNIDHEDVPDYHNTQNVLQQLVS
jgi:hypothetical protein